MTNQQPRKTFVQGNEAMIVCPECDAAKAISAVRFRHRQKLIKVKCKCGHLFRVHLEFRRHFRKPTELDGTYDSEAADGVGGKIKIINLSFSGACFEVRTIHGLEIDQRGSLIFTLDNPKESILFKKVVIKTIIGNRIGCEFVEERAYEKELGFYLFP
jgi:hypothetical protein